MHVAVFPMFLWLLGLGLPRKWGPKQVELRFAEAGGHSVWTLRRFVVRRLLVQYLHALVLVRQHVLLQARAMAVVVRPVWRLALPVLFRLPGVVTPYLLLCRDYVPLVGQLLEVGPALPLLVPPLWLLPQLQARARVALLHHVGLLFAVMPLCLPAGLVAPYRLVCKCALPATLKPLMGLLAVLVLHVKAYRGPGLVQLHVVVQRRV